MLGGWKREELFIQSGETHSSPPGFQFVAGSERREKTAIGAHGSCSVVTSNQIRLVGKEVEHCVQAWDDSTPSFINGYLGSHVQFFKIHRLLMLRVQSSKL